MRQTDSNIREWMTDLMRSARLLLPLAMRLRSAMMLTVAVVAVLAVVSCGSGSGDDPGTPVTPVQPGKPGEPATDMPIAFSASQQDETDVTRTRAPLESKVDRFTVYGYKNTGPEGNPYSAIQTVFPGYIVKYDGGANSTTTNTNGWEYVNQQSSGPEQTIKYWDMDARAYRFFGVAKGDGDYTMEEVKEDGQPKEYKISFRADATTLAKMNKAPYFSKLWFSTGSPGEPQFGKPVQLMFLRPFARVRFMFTQSYPDAVLLVDEKSFAPVDENNKIVNVCDITVTYPLTGNATEESYRNPAVSWYENNFTEDYVESDTNPRWYNVIAPQSLGAFRLNVKVNGVAKTVFVPAEYMNWLPGYEYTYVFKITEQGGVEIDAVQTGFTPWTEVLGSHELYNW